MRMSFVIAALILFSPQAYAAEENTLLPFTSDGCSMAPDRGWLTHRDWVQCCVNHDKAYWLGGTAPEKKNADIVFKQCLLSVGMKEVEAEVFYRAVERGGSPDLPTTWRWGYGWKTSRGYAPISEKEREQAKQYAKLLDLPIQVVIPDSKIREVLPLKNYCREDVLRRVAKRTGIKDPQALIMAAVETEFGRDAFQVFSPECKGGYFLVTFKKVIGGGRCHNDDYYNLPDQVEAMKAFGDCSFKNSAPAGPEAPPHPDSATSPATKNPRLTERITKRIIETLWPSSSREMESTAESARSQK